MQIVINIDDADYDDITLTGENTINLGVLLDLREAVRKGTPLPKGHGRLIDANRLRSMYSINRANFNTVVGIQKWIDEAPTIIEAESEEQAN